MPKTKNPTLPPSNQYDYTTKTPATKISDAEISSSGFRPATRPSKNPCFAAPGASAYNSYYHPGASLDNPVGGSRCADASSEELDRAIGGAKKKKKTEGCQAAAAKKLQECVKMPFGKPRVMSRRSGDAKKEAKKKPRAVAELGSGRKRGRPAAEGGKLHIPKSIKKAVSKGATKLVNQGEKVARKQGEKALKKGVAMAESEGQKALDKGINMAKDKAMSYVNPEPMDGGMRQARMRELFDLLTNDPSGGKHHHHFGKALKHVGKAAVKTAKKQHLGKKVGKIAKDYAKEMAPEAAAAAATAIGQPEMAPGAAAFTQNAVKGLGKPKRTNARAQIVGKIMKERGVGLAEASKIVKAEGLYKK